MNKQILHISLVLISLVLFTTGRAQDSLKDILSPPEVSVDTIYQNEAASQENSYQYKEITEPSPVHARRVSATDLNKLRSDEDYWYVNQVPPRQRETSSPDVNEKGKREKEVKKPSGIFTIRWLNILFWVILIGGFIALLAWFLSTSNIRLFRRKPKTIEEATGELPTDNIFEMNFEKEIQRAIDEKNYRMAVRLMYLRTLRELSDRNLINYTHEKTNSDYLFQLAGTSYYKNFFRLTRSFDYTWYGQFALSQDSFAIIQNDFSSFKRQLS